jgi:hypothetical protein
MLFAYIPFTNFGTITLCQPPAEILAGVIGDRSKIGKQEMSRQD